MASPRAQSLLQHLYQLVGASAADQLTDTELVQRFVTQHDEHAFAALVRRHGPVVLRLCRHLLRHEQDAEDVFQATFLMLTRKAGSLRSRGSVGSWLYGVAYRLALRARQRANRQRVCEARVPARPADDVLTEVTVREAQAIVDEELARLPEKYRAPLVLCCLEGKARDEAAQLLGWSLSRLKNHLEQGREQLRRRLAQRGITLSAGLLATVLADKTLTAAIPLTLVRVTTQTAVLLAKGRGVAGMISPGAALLMKGALQAMFWSKVRTLVAVLFIMGLVGSGTPAFLRWVSGGTAEASAGVPDNQAGDPAEERQATATQPPAQENQPAVDPRQEAQHRLQSQNNLKQIGLAMHNYHDVYGHFPPPAIYSGVGQPQELAAGLPGGPGPGMGDRPAGMGGMMRGGMPGMGRMSGMGPGGMGPGGRGGMMGGGMMPGGPGGMAPAGVGPGGFMPGGMGPGGMGPAGIPNVGQGKALLSWRVALLPFLGEDQLFQQFKLDEPWDSPHNKKLLARIPKVYAAPGKASQDPYATYYQGFIGPGSFFEKHRALRIAEIVDGTSNTFMVVEAGSPVPWTKPEDLAYDPDQPLPQLGGLFRDLFHVLLCDGAVLALSKEAPEDILRPGITRNGGEILDLTKATAPAAGRGMSVIATQLQQEKQRLQQALQQATKDLEGLKKDLAVAKELAEPDRKALELMRENAQLQAALAKIREEMQALRKEIDALKKNRSERREE